jgi:hypothetical protein
MKRKKKKKRERRGAGRCRGERNYIAADWEWKVRPMERPALQRAVP